jgi:hypothetical protein
MTAGEFADFWRVQGYRVIETKSCYWYNPSPLVFVSVPYHRGITPLWGELGHVLLSGPAVAIRFHDSAEGPGGLFVCSDRNRDLSCLHKKARNQTHRGLENCRIEQLDFAYLAKYGPALNAQTFQRQGRDRQTITSAQWQRYCRAASRIPDFEAWGAFANGHLAAFLVAGLVEDHFSILHQSSSTGDLQYYPNNALTFTVARLKLSCPAVGCVSYGLKSLDDTVGLDQFKLKMGFKLRPLREHVVLNPLLKPFFSFGGRRIVQWMSRKHPETDLWRKAAGVLQQRRGALDAG